MLIPDDTNERTSYKEQSGVFFVTNNYPEITKDILGNLKAFRQNQAGVMQVFSKNACMLLLLMNNLA
ncbi:MAG: hypothetical protein ACK5O9_03910 [Holosporales bacterium]